jgi:O-methyltransferase
MKKIIAAIRYFYKAFFKNDEYAKFVILENVASLIYPKYKFSEFGRTFLNDSEFISDYYMRQCGNNFHSLDRKYFLRELIKLVNHIDGHTAECGVYLGASSYLICLGNEKSNFKKVHYLFDSFEGLSLPDPIDGTYWAKGNLSAPEIIVRENLIQFDNCEYFKGWIPSQFYNISNRKFSFVHVDVDLYQPTLDSISFFYDRLLPGGIILCDDYGFTSCPGAKLAMDEFFNRKPEQIIQVPTGQAFIIKI